MKKYWLILVALVLASSIGCSSSDSSSDPIQNEQTGNTSGLLSNSNEIAVPSSLPAASRAMTFDYTMTGVTGEQTIARAQLFEPMSQAPADGHALVVWAHGTTGISNACQPSLSFNGFGNATAINALLAAGYAVLAPDYEGFGTDQIHPYYVRSSHANAITSSVPAVHQLEGSNFSDDWAVVGHSQGGHVALATARASAQPAYPLQAVVALAPGTDLMPFSDRAFDAIDQAIAEGNTNNALERLFYMNVYGAFVAHAFKEVEPTFDPASIFGSNIAPLIDEAVTEGACGNYARAVEQSISLHFAAGGTFSDFGGLIRNWYDDPVLAARLEAEAFGDEAQSAPLLIVQGDADRQVPVAATSAFVDQQRSVGTDVTYQELPGARHGDVARAEFGRVMTWLDEKFPPR